MRKLTQSEQRLLELRRRQQVEFARMMKKCPSLRGKVFWQEMLALTYAQISFLTGGGE